MFSLWNITYSNHSSLQKTEIRFFNWFRYLSLIYRYHGLNLTWCRLPTLSSHPVSAVVLWTSTTHYQLLFWQGSLWLQLFQVTCSIFVERFGWDDIVCIQGKWLEASGRQLCLHWREASKADVGSPTYNMRMNDQKTIFLIDCDMRRFNKSTEVDQWGDNHNS